MGEYPTGPPESATYAVHSMKDVGPVIIFAYWGLVVLSLTSYLLIKRALLKKRPAPPVYMSHASMELEEANKPAFVPEEDLKAATNDSRVDVPHDKTIQFQVGPFLLLMEPHYAYDQHAGK